MPEHDQEDHGEGEGPLIAAGHRCRQGSSRHGTSRHWRRRDGGHAGELTVTVVPAPGRLATAALPPAACIRPVIDSRMPRRDGAVAAGPNPRPRAVTVTAAQPSPPVAAAYA